MRNALGICSPTRAMLLSAQNAGTLDEVIHSRIIEQRLPPPWEQCAIPLWMLDPAVLPEPCARSLSDGGAYNPAQGGLRGYPERSDKIRDSMLRLESVLFIGTQFSILYTSMYSPAEAATRTCKSPRWKVSRPRLISITPSNRRCTLASPQNYCGSSPWRRVGASDAWHVGSVSAGAVGPRPPRGPQPAFGTHKTSESGRSFTTIIGLYTFSFIP